MDLGQAGNLYDKFAGFLEYAGYQESVTKGD